MIECTCTAELIEAVAQDDDARRATWGRNKHFQQQIDVIANV